MPAETSGSSKKRGGGFLSRQIAKSKKNEGVTEDILSSKEAVVPDDVLRLSGATKGTYSHPQLLTTRVLIRSTGALCLMTVVDFYASKNFNYICYGNCREANENQNLESLRVSMLSAFKVAFVSTAFSK